MMRAVTFQAGRIKKAVQPILQPPIQGLNTLVHPTALQPTEATVLDNWFVDGADVKIRCGYTVEQQVDASAAPTLIPYELCSTSAFLIAAGGKIFRWKDNGLLAEMESGFTSDRWSFTTQSDHLFMVNGTETRLFDGTTLSTPVFDDNAPVTAWTGCVGHNERIYLWKEDSLDFYYLDPAAIQGPVHEFPLCNLGNIRGSIVQIATWSYDAGHGLNDFLVILTSKGDILVYEGIDPSDPADWRLTGRFRSAPPVPGGRSAVKLGADLILMTTEGLLSLTATLQAGESAINATRAYSAKVHPKAAALARTSTMAEAQAIMDPAGRMLIFNARDESGNIVQLVQGLASAAWSTFSGLPALSWAEYRGQLYFIDADGRICLFWNGDSDNGAEITARYESGMMAMANGATFQTKWFAPVMSAPGGFTVSVRASGDFRGANLTDPFTFEPEEVIPPSDLAEYARAQLGIISTGARVQIGMVVGNRGGDVQWVSSEISAVIQGRRR